MENHFEFDFDRFLEGLKRINKESGASQLDMDSTEKDRYMVIGWQNCIEKIIDLIKECM